MGKAVSRCVILAAAPVEDVAPLRPLLCPDDVFVAADGGLVLADALGVRPLRVVADFDSASFTPNDAPVTRLPVRKDITDTAAALRWARAQGYTDFLLLGGLGGRLDHEYANICTAVEAARAGCRLMLADGRNRVFAAVSSPLTIPAQPGWHLSFFAFDAPVRGLTLRGVEYELTDYALLPEDPLCVSNGFAAGQATVTFTEGTLLVFLSRD